MIAKVNLKPIEDLVQEFKIGERGYLYLVDNQGNLIAHSQREDLVGQNFKEILGVKNLLLGDSQMKKEEKYLGILAKKVKRLNNLIDEILEVAKEEGGRIEIKVSSQDIDITEIISSLVEDYKKKAEKKYRFKISISKTSSKSPG